MPEDRLGRIFDDIHATLDRIDRQLTHVFWLMMALLTGTLILFVKVFFFWDA